MAPNKALRREVGLVQVPSVERNTLSQPTTIVVSIRETC